MIIINVVYIFVLIKNESGNEDVDVANRDDESREKQFSAGFSFHFQKDYTTISFSIVFSIITAVLSHT